MSSAQQGECWVEREKQKNKKRCCFITTFADFRMKMLPWITSGLVTEPQPSPNDLACQCLLNITTSISSTDGWTSTDLTALYRPEGVAVFLTWHVERMDLVTDRKKKCQMSPFFLSIVVQIGQPCSIIDPSAFETAAFLLCGAVNSLTFLPWFSTSNLCQLHLFWTHF